jgi:feruloyl-CoA synthase
VVLAAGSPYIHDVVFVGQDRDELGMLVFLSAMSSRLSADGVHEWLTELLAQIALRAGGGSQRVTRALVLEQPPSVAAGEITDKGTINQRAVIQGRQAMVERLYSSQRSPGVVVLS